jgi:formylglycine-generating enzyme required for sulfatase activity
MFTNMGNPATVSDFYLDKYEVTVARFRAFVIAGMGTQRNPPAAGAGAHASIANSGWDSSWNTSLPADATALKASLTNCEPGKPVWTWTDAPGGNDNRPLNCVSWYEAFAFCIWDGGYLPTEAESSYAALGGNLQRAYPWSVPASDLTIGASDASYDSTGTGCNSHASCVVTDLVNVGSLPAGDALWGQSDLAGNVTEWVLDWYASAMINPCHDCANLTPSSARKCYNGALNTPAYALRGASRLFYSPPGGTWINVGFRCARA